jgi:hypothetical protein
MRIELGCDTVSRCRSSTKGGEPVDDVLPGWEYDQGRMHGLRGLLTRLLMVQNTRDISILGNAIEL